MTGVLKRFNMLDSRPVATPAPSGMSMTAEEELPGLGPEIPYRSAVGSLLHAAIGTRFDIAHAVSQVGRFSATPKLPHWVQVKRILRYLNGTRGLLHSILSEQ